MTLTTIVLLFAVGLLGVLVQAVKKMDELNQSNNGNFKFSAYIRSARFSILLSILLVITSIICAYMMPELAHAGNKLVLGLFTIGYTGQSGLEFLIGLAKKRIGSKTGATDDELNRL